MTPHEAVDDNAEYGMVVIHVEEDGDVKVVAAFDGRKFHNPADPGFDRADASGYLADSIANYVRGRDSERDGEPAPRHPNSSRPHHPR